MAAQVSDWFERWSEPIRARSRHPALDQFGRNAAWFGIATSPFLRDWFRPLSESVRSRSPLPRGAMPYHFANIPHIGYRFALTELGDISTLTFVEYARKNLARVTITELQTYPSRVTIREIKYTRGYS